MPPPPWVVAHRGDSRHAPENSLEALRRAVAAGADMIEIDVQLDAEGVLRVFHDQDARRLTGERGALETMTPDRLRSLRLGGNGESVPTLPEALAALPPEVPLNVELKRWVASRDDLVSALLGALASRHDVLVSSFDWECLRTLRARAPGIPLAPLGSRDAQALLAEAEVLAAWSVHAHRRLADASLIEEADRAGRPLLVYTVDDVADAAALFAHGVRGVFTNDPGRLRSALSDAGPGVPS